MALKTVKFLGTTLTALALATALNGCASVSGQTTLERDYDFTRMQNMTMVFYREFLSNEKITNNFKKEFPNLASFYVTRLVLTPTLGGGCYFGLDWFYSFH